MRKEWINYKSFQEKFNKQEYLELTGSTRG